MVIKLKCNHCFYVWNYKGQREYQATCPNCSYKVFLKQIKKGDIK